MANHPERRAVAAAKRQAKAAGYYVREGEYVGGSGADNYLGRWYFGHVDDDFFRPIGRGHATRSAAWLAAAEQIALYDKS